MTEWEPRRKSALYGTRPVEQLNLKPRLRQALRDHGYLTIGDILTKTVAELLDMPRMGMSALGTVVNQADQAELTARVEALEENVRELGEIVSYHLEHS